MKPKKSSHKLQGGLFYQSQKRLSVHSVAVLHAFLDTLRRDFHGLTRSFTTTELLVILVATSGDQEHTYRGKYDDFSLHLVPYGLEVYQLPSAL